jgi:hypothetical protein
MCEVTLRDHGSLQPHAGALHSSREEAVASREAGFHWETFLSIK